MTEATTENQNAANQEVSTEIPLYAEPIFHIGKFPVTNTLINSWVAVFILVIFFVAAGRKIQKVPRGIQNFFEFILEKLLDFADSITGDREKTKRFMPIVMTFFLFILVNNWLGIVPGVGTIGFIEQEGIHKIFVPIFRGAASDINTTLTLAIIAILSSHVMGIGAIGGWKHFNKFINLKALLHAPREIKKDWTALFSAPIAVFVGLLEIIGEFSRIASLSFRLFGNIFAGEVLLTSMMALFAYAVPVPFLFLEIFVGAIQALVFSTLALVFMTMNCEAHEH
jgi:F-type H+-transporting ATPase subunit a